MKIVKIALIIGVFNSFAWGCGGCTDAGTATQLSSQSAMKFEQLEAKLAASIEEIGRELHKQYVQNEVKNLRESRVLTELSKHKLLMEQNVSFVLELQNKLQSTNNAIDGL